MQKIGELYTIGSIIGVGGYGDVREAISKQLDKRCAIKIVRKSKVLKTEYRKKNIQNELNIL